MHEASLIRNLMRKIDSLAEVENAIRVTTVQIWLGALSHMSAAHFRQHFELASKGTIADGASLEIEESTDIRDPNAQELLLRRIEVET
jgi:hydrogenase nickel incorporation protein HypA/HybF